MSDTKAQAQAKVIAREKVAFDPLMNPGALFTPSDPLSPSPSSSSSTTSTSTSTSAPKDKSPSLSIRPAAVAVDVSEQLFFSPARANSVTSPRARVTRTGSTSGADADPTPSSAITIDSFLSDTDTVSSSSTATATATATATVTSVPSVPVSLFGTSNIRRNPNNLFEDDEDVPVLTTKKPAFATSTSTSTTTTTTTTAAVTTTTAPSSATSALTNAISDVADGLASTSITTASNASSGTRRAVTQNLPHSPAPLSTMMTAIRKGGDMFSPDAPESAADRNLSGLFIPNNAVEKRQDEDVFQAPAVDKDLLEVEPDESLDRFTRRGSKQKQVQAASQTQSHADTQVEPDKEAEEEGEEDEEEEEDDGSPIIRAPVEEDLDDDLFALAGPSTGSSTSAGAGVDATGFDFSSYIAQNSKSDGAKLFDD